MADSLKDNEFDYLFKTILIGDSSVGKSNLLSRFVWDQFRFDSKPTIGVEFAYWNTKVGNKFIKAHIWDTAGQERFRAFTSSYYRGALGALLVYDITRRSTFNNLLKWLTETRDYGDSDMVIMLVGNKTDLGYAREVSREEGERFAETEGLCFMETSALENLNVGEAFLQLITRIYEVKSKNSLDANSSQLAQTIRPTTGITILHLDEVSETEQVEALSSEKATLLLRIETVSRMLDENKSAIPLADSAGPSVSIDLEAGRWNASNSRLKPFLESRFRSGGEHFGSLLRQLDAIFSAGAAFIRRNPAAKLWSLVYFVCLHFWVVYILLSHSQPSDDTKSGAVISLGNINNTGRI